MQNNRHERPQVVIVGGGFAGLYAAKGLRSAPVAVTLVDRRNFHLFQPLLYQVATGALSPADIAFPLRRLFRRHDSVRVVMGEVEDIDVSNRRVQLEDQSIPFDQLVIATGSVDHYFGNDEWSSVAPGLKTIEDAGEIRRKVLRAFEAAERSIDADERRALLNFVVVGAGPTGVELAGAIAELATDSLRRDFHELEPSCARVLLLEGADRVLPTYPAELSDAALRSLERLGVIVRTKTYVTEVREGCVVTEHGGTSTTVPARTVVWAAGVRASPFGEMLAAKSGVRCDRRGRVFVTPELRVPDHPDITVVGDLAAVRQDGEMLPALAAVAMQQGTYVAKRIRRELRDKTLKPFRYRDRGALATIGRAAAVADFGRRMRFSGFPAWLLWLFVHIMYLIGFQNRLLVLIQWAWNYVTRNRSARLVTSRYLPYSTGEATAETRAEPAVLPWR